MAVRAKFKVVTVTDTDIRLEAVTSGSPENEQFFKYTPSGTITLGILNPDAVSQFDPGKEYYVDFLPAG